MNMVKLNNKLTAQVISFTEIMQSYMGISECSNCYTYHKENGAEVIDIDFRLHISEENGLYVEICKSYDKNTISGGHYMGDENIQCDIKALECWLEDNGIYSRQAHDIANRLYSTVCCICEWSIMQNEFYRELYTEYEKCSCETATAVKILLEKCTDMTDRYYIEKTFYEIQVNEEKINSLF